MITCDLGTILQRPFFNLQFTVFADTKTVTKSRLHCTVNIKKYSEIIDSGPTCITDLFQNKYLAYFNPK